MNVVLLEPEIPPNTGNVARLCAATNTTLHLIEPFGFKLDDAQLKRAGMDYWQHVSWHRWKNWTDFAAQLPTAARLWFIESGGPTVYSEVRFGADLTRARTVMSSPTALVILTLDQLPSTTLESVGATGPDENAPWLWMKVPLRPAKRGFNV